VIKFPLPNSQKFKRFIPLLSASGALLLSQGQAKAVLTYNIFESSGNVVVETSGSLNLAGAIVDSQDDCGSGQKIIPNSATICTVPGTVITYSITGPTSFSNGGIVSVGGSSSSGIPTALQGATSVFGLPSAYVSGTPIVSSATFANQTLASLGFTISSGPLGVWALNGTSETIQVFLGPPSPSGAAVPGPLPLLGAGAAFTWSRRLRKRIAAPGIATPQA
jgi:hypothetical protein